MSAVDRKKNPSLPTSWGDAEILDGLPTLDKVQLVGKPFMITDIWFHVGSRDVEYCNFEAVFPDGSKFMFNDSSTTGAKYQVEEYFNLKGINITHGEIYPIKIVAPEGLIRREFKVRDIRGVESQAKTYSISTSGQRAGSVEPETKVPARGRKPAAS